MTFAPHGTRMQSSAIGGRDDALLDDSQPGAMGLFIASESCAPHSPTWRDFQGGSDPW
jgi:hypothetical protein